MGLAPFLRSTTMALHRMARFWDWLPLVMHHDGPCGAGALGFQACGVGRQGSICLCRVACRAHVNTAAPLIRTLQLFVESTYGVRRSSCWWGARRAHSGTGTAISTAHAPAASVAAASRRQLKATAYAPVCERMVTLVATNQECKQVVCGSCQSAGPPPQLSPRCRRGIMRTSA